MYLEIENIQTFLGMLDAGGETKETTPIFIKEVKGWDEKTGSLSADIIIQSQFDTNMVLQHRLTEGIQVVQFYPAAVLVLIEQEKGVDARKLMEKEVEESKEKQDAQIVAEKTKITKILQEKGYKIFIPGVWQL